MNGQLQKNGGNVASFFCTPDVKVIHATAKPINADQLLREATWAVTTYREVLEQEPKSLPVQMKLVEQAHLKQLKQSSWDFDSKVRAELPRAQQDYRTKMQRDRNCRCLESPLLVARRNAARSFGGDRVHQIMLAQPLQPLQSVYREVFEKLTNERANEDRGVVYAAAKGFEVAREKGLPVLLVLYRGQGDNKDEWDSPTKELFEKVLCTRQVLPVLRHYVRIFVPKRQLSALSNLAELPVYEASRHSGPSIIITDSLGKQIDSFYGSISPGQFAMQLCPAIHEAKMTHAEKLASQGEHSSALKVLYQVRSVPTSEANKQRTLRLKNRIRFQLAEKWLAEGSRRRALRTFTSLSKLAKDEDLRQRSKEYMTQLRSGNEESRIAAASGND